MRETFISKDKMVEFECNDNVLISLTFLKKIKKPYFVYIPKSINGYEISKIGSGYLSLSAKQCMKDNTPVAYDKRVSIIVDNDIEEIGSGAFKGMSLKELHWPEKCRTIPSHCFEGSIIEEFSGMENVSKIETKAFFGTAMMDSFCIPDSCTALGDRAFAESFIYEITGGESIENVGIAVFENSSLSNMKWFPKVQTIPESTFYFCTNLRTISGIENVTNIGRLAFFYTLIEEMDISDTLIENIDEDAFKDCILLTQFIPNGICSVSATAFCGTPIYEGSSA